MNLVVESLSWMQGGFAQKDIRTNALRVFNFIVLILKTPRMRY